MTRSVYYVVDSETPVDYRNFPTTSGARTRERRMQGGGVRVCITAELAKRYRLPAPPHLHPSGRALSSDDFPPPNNAPFVFLDGAGDAFEGFVDVHSGLGGLQPIEKPGYTKGGRWVEARYAMGSFGACYKAKLVSDSSQAVAVKLTKMRWKDGLWEERYGDMVHHNMILEEVHVHRKATLLCMCEPGDPPCARARGQRCPKNRHICALLGAFETKPMELSALVHMRSPCDCSGGRPRLALVQEFLGGHDLNQVMEASEQLPGVCTPSLGPVRATREYNEVDKRNMFSPLCKALAKMHEAGIVHRDIKPENICLREQPKPGQTPELVFIDFGLAIDLERGDVRVGRNQIIGDPAFAAPELFEGNGTQYLGLEPHTSGTQFHNRYGRAYDVFAMGVTLYQFLIGHKDTYPLPYLFNGRTMTWAEKFSNRKTSRLYRQQGHTHHSIAHGVSPFVRDWKKKTTRRWPCFLFCFFMHGGKQNKGNASLLTSTPPPPSLPPACFSPLRRPWTCWTKCWTPTPPSALPWRGCSSTTGLT